MASHTRKNLRTSNTIFEYPEPSPARRFIDGCISLVILVALALGTGGAIYLVSNLW